MPYTSNADLPLSVQDALPVSAQSLFRSSYNGAASRGLKEDRAMMVAWSAVKNAGYEKDKETGDWVKKSNAGSDLPGDLARAAAFVRAQKRATNGENYVPLFTADIKKVSADDQRLVFGWASIVEDEAGNLIVDSQGDTITPDELEKAAHNFMSDSRAAGFMHNGKVIGKIVQSLVVTKATEEALGVSFGKCGWFIVMKVEDPDVWARVKTGELSAFSIGGRGVRKEIHEAA